MEANTVAMEAAREFLGRARELRREIDNKQRRIQTLRDMATSTTGKMSALHGKLWDSTQATGKAR